MSVPCGVDFALSADGNWYGAGVRQRRAGINESGSFLGSSIGAEFQLEPAVF